jgi:ubiquinone/menaquinone biosynthesis C-methylase UbiE
MVAALMGISTKDKILDLGSGVGYYVKSWIDNGYKHTKGIEISKTAIENSKVSSRLTHGSVADMRMFHDKEFDLVFSSAFFEHVDDSILETVIKECTRIGKKQAHLIDYAGKTNPKEVEIDPSHINMKSAKEWHKIFYDTTLQPVMLFDDLLQGDWPIVGVLDVDNIHYPLLRCIDKQQARRRAMRELETEQRQYDAVQL